MFRKKKEPTEQDLALAEMIAARNKYEQALDNFNNADFDFFEIANSELTIAKLQLEVSILKLQKLYEVTKIVPQSYPIKAIYYPNGF